MTYRYNDKAVPPWYHLYNGNLYTWKSVFLLKQTRIALPVPVSIPMHSPLSTLVIHVELYHLTDGQRIAQGHWGLLRSRAVCHFAIDLHPSHIVGGGLEADLIDEDLACEVTATLLGVAVVGLRIKRGAITHAAIASPVGRGIKGCDIKPRMLVCGLFQWNPFDWCHWIA